MSNEGYQLPTSELGRKTFVAVLERLYVEWDLGCREETIIAPEKLLQFYKQHSLASSQLIAVLTQLTARGALVSHELFMGSWTEYEEAGTALSIAFAPSFEDIYVALHKELSTLANTEATASIVGNILFVLGRETVKLTPSEATLLKKLLTKEIESSHGYVLYSPVLSQELRDSTRSIGSFRADLKRLRDTVRSFHEHPLIEIDSIDEGKKKTPGYQMKLNMEQFKKVQDL
jgi:hypothetical protein